MDNKGDDQAVCQHEVIIKFIGQLAQMTAGSEEYTNAVEQMIKDEQLLDTLRRLLSNSSAEINEGATVSAQFIAELAKAEVARGMLYDEGFISLLVPLLNSDDKDLCLQCIRALGNLCYEQDKSREKIIEVKGLEYLNPLLQFCINQHTSHLKLKTACCGFLHNLLNANELCVKAVLGTDIINSLKDMLERNAMAHPIASFCYMTFTSIAEVEGGREALCKAEVVPVLLRLFVNTNVADTDEVLLNILSTMASDFDDVKKLFAESSLDMHLLKIISLLSSKTDEESQQLVKGASELLVLVLTGDEAMNIWFDGGDGYVFASISEWLQSSNGQLLQSAAFAIGNFARGENNSNVIIQRGISLELYKSLDQLRGVCDDARTAPTIHAILSALRNMAIAPSNKLQLLEQGILGHLLPYIKSDNSIVTSKLIGVIRLLIDGHEQESTLLVRNEEVVERLVEFADSQTNALLKGESMRCLAWIIKISRDAEALQTVLKKGGFKHLVSLAGSEHLIMQNEGILGVMVLTKVHPEETKKAIQESSLISTLVEKLNQHEAAKELLGNILLLIIEFLKLGLKQELIESELRSCIETLPSKTSDPKTLDALTYIKAQLEM